MTSPNQKTPWSQSCGLQLNPAFGFRVSRRCVCCVLLCCVVVSLCACLLRVVVCVVFVCCCVWCAVCGCVCGVCGCGAEKTRRVCIRNVTVCVPTGCVSNVHATGGFHQRKHTWSYRLLQRLTKYPLDLTDFANKARTTRFIFSSETYVLFVLHAYTSG